MIVNVAYDLKNADVSKKSQFSNDLILIPTKFLFYTRLKNNHLFGLVSEFINAPILNLAGAVGPIT